MRRVIVLGGTGFFGRLIVEKLAQAGLTPVAASRSSGELRIDANNAEDLRTHLKQRDLVVDAAGPFHARTPALIQAARTIGFDVIDISDDPKYAAMVYENEAPIRAAGIRVLTACSSLSTISALVVKTSGIDQPRKLSVYLRPATRFTANPGAVRAFLHGIEGRSRTIKFMSPVGPRSGVTMKSVDAITLRRSFPTLDSTEFFVDSAVPAANALLRFKPFRDLVARFEKRALQMAHRFGAKEGMLAYEVSSTMRHKQQIFAGPRSYMLAVIPAIEAAVAIASGKFAHRGIVPPADHAPAAAVFEAARREGITIIT